MNYDTALYSERGGRIGNEDVVTIAGMPGKILALAADGLGGMGNGDMAANDTVTYLSALFNCKLEEDLLCSRIQEENKRILDMHRDGKQMMSTIAAFWSDGELTLAATMGDTRLYQFRSGQIISAIAVIVIEEPENVE